MTFIFKFALLCVCCLPVCAAQEALYRGSAPGVEIGGVLMNGVPEHKPSLDPGPTARAETRLNSHDLHGEIERGALPPAPAKLSGSSVTLVVTVKNRSDLAVREFWWNVALTDMTGSPDYARRLMHSGSPLKAGESRKLTASFSFNKHWAGFTHVRPPKMGKILRVDVPRVIYANGSEWRSTRSRNITMMRPFTLHSRTLYKKPDGHTLMVKEAFYSFSDGSLCYTLDAEGARQVDQVYLPSRGVFAIDRLNRTMLKDLKIFSIIDGCYQLRTVQDLRESANFFQEQELLGVTAYVHRFADPRGGQMVRDIYYAVELGCRPLKVVFYREGKIEKVIEPVSLTFGEPDRALLQIPDYPVVEGHGL